MHLRTFRKKEKYEAVLSLENTHRLWLPVSAALLTRETCLSFVTTKGNFADEDVMEITSMRVTSWRILSVDPGAILDQIGKKHLRAFSRGSGGRNRQVGLRMRQTSFLKTPNQIKKETGIT